MAGHLIVIDPNRYSLTPHERIAIEHQLAEVGSDPSLEELWGLMDEAWTSHACDNHSPNSNCLANFYSDPVWLLNGMFIEQHAVSMGHRQAITEAVAALAPGLIQSLSQALLPRLSAWAEVGGVAPSLCLTVLTPQPIST